MSDTRIYFVKGDPLFPSEDAVGIYCVGIAGLKLPGLRENTLHTNMGTTSRKREARICSGNCFTISCRPTTWR